MAGLKKILDRLDIEILNAELYSVGKEWNYRNVNNPYSRIYLVTEGEAEIKIGGKKYGLRPGHMYLIPCFKRVNMHCAEFFRHYYIHFTSRIETGLDILSILKCKYEVRAKDFGVGKEIFDRIIELNPGRELFEYDANKPIYKRVTERAAELDNEKSVSSIIECNALMRLLISVFLRDCDERTVSDAAAGLSRFHVVTEYIRENLDTQLSLAELAGVAEMHPTYFSNLFSKLMGISPIQYVNRRRIEKAQTLLLSSHATLEDIAMEVGFLDVFYFSRVFKKLVGVAPSVYRTQQIQS